MTVEAALTYAAAGWPVLALYTVENGCCTCGKPDCKSPGKHPRPDLCPHGVKDATTDAHRISSWPQGINIGVALGAAAGSALAFDVDDREIAARLVHPNLGLSDHTGVVFTGRAGAHIWFRTTGGTKTFHVKDVNGHRIGEVRGDDTYVVVPPSTSITGRLYKWLGRRREDPPPQLGMVSDPVEYVRSLLGAVDVVMGDVAPASEVRGEPSEKIQACGIPTEIAADAALTQYRQVLASGLKVVEPDRSKRLMALAHDLVEAAERKQYDLSPETLAGVLRDFDEKAFAIPKYAGREDSDRRYWELAQKVLADVQAAQPVQLHPDYTWDEADGALYYHPTPKVVRKVCNFRPQILEDLLIDDGGQREHKRRCWPVRCTLKGGTSETIVLDSDDVGSTTAFQAAINRELPVRYHVCPGMYETLRTAMRALSGDAPQGRIFETTGWVEYGGEWLYLLPSAAGAIGSHGLDTSVRIEKERLPRESPVTFEALEPYGRGVRPATNAAELERAWLAFQKLLEVGPAASLVPIVLQVLAGPLTTAGVGAVPPLIHVMGRTGTLKTAYCLAALSLFGTFTDQSPVPANWGSTPTSLRIMMYVTKDLTLLVDDYKRSTVGRKSEMLSLIQSYAEKSFRGRGSPSQKLQVAQPSRGLLLSNGEDRWEREASAEARTITVTFRKGDLDLHKLSQVQAAIADGTLQVFGGTYLSWLARQQALLDGLTFAEHKARIYRILLKAKEKEVVHLRVLASLASLFSVSSIVGTFLEEMVSKEAHLWFKGKVKQGLDAQLAGVTEKALEVEESAAFRLLITALAEQLSAREVCLYPAKGISEEARTIPQKPGAKVVAYYWLKDGQPDWVLLTHDTTFAWYEGELRSRGQEASFSWSQFLKDAEDRGCPRVAKVRVKAEGERVTQLSGVSIPAALLIADGGCETSV